MFVIGATFLWSRFSLRNPEKPEHREKGCSIKIFRKLVSKVVPNVISGTEHFDFPFLEGFLNEFVYV